MVIGSLVTNVVANLSQWGPNLNKAQGQLAAFTRNITVMQAAIGTAVAGTLAALVRSTTDQASALHDTAEKLQINVESLQEYRYAAEQMGSTANTLDRSLLILNKTVGNAAMGSASASAKLSKLGLDARKLKDQSLDRTFLDVVEAIRQLPTPVEQSAAAVAAFGKSGQDLLQVIRAGSDEIKRFGIELQNSGGVIDPEMVRRLESLGDKINLTTKAFAVMKMEAVGSFAEPLSGAFDMITESIKKTRAEFLIFFQIGPKRFQRWIAQDLFPIMSTKDIEDLNREIFRLKSEVAQLRGRPAPSPGDLHYRHRFGPASALPALRFNNPAIPRDLPSRIPFAPEITNIDRFTMGIYQQREAEKRGIAQNIQNFQRALTGVLNLLPAKIQTAIGLGKLPEPAQKFFSGLGRIIGQTGGIGGLLGTASGRAMGIAPALTMTRAGSAESYRQRQAIGKQNEELKIHKENLKETRKGNSLLERLVQFGSEMAPANIF